MTMALDGGERVIAIGRDMRAVAAMQQRLLQTQQALERDYIRLRQAESRYRLLFDVASEAVLIVDAETRRIREANPAAHRLLDAAEGALIGNSVHSIVDPANRDDFIAHLGAAEASDDLAGMSLGWPTGAARRVLPRGCSARRGRLCCWCGWSPRMARFPSTIATTRP